MCKCTVGAPCYIKKCQDHWLQCLKLKCLYALKVNCGGKINLCFYLLDSHANALKNKFYNQIMCFH